MSLKRQRVDPKVLEPYTDFVLLVLHNHDEASDLFLFPRSAEFKDILVAFRYAAHTHWYEEIKELDDDNKDKLLAHQLIMMDLLCGSCDEQQLTVLRNAYGCYFGKPFVRRSYFDVFLVQRERVNIGCKLQSVSEVITINGTNKCPR